MWTCNKCREQVEDSFDVSWKCGTSKDGVETTNFQPETATEETDFNPIQCPRCNQLLEYVGKKSFHEGSNWGVLGALGELFVNRESFDVYVCPKCGRVELFVDGIGDQYRPH